MENVWVLAAIWVGLALIATLLAIWLKISTALTEIVVGTVAQLVIGAVAGSASLGAKSDWVSFLAGTGAIVLTFLAGAELDPAIFRTKWKEATTVGLVGFFAPFSRMCRVRLLPASLEFPSEFASGGRAFDHLGGGRLRGDVGTRV
jgi:glutathione-regulated potassium-efflux system ancillary protein KefC